MGSWVLRKPHFWKWDEGSASIPIYCKPACVILSFYKRSSDYCLRRQHELSSSFLSFAPYGLNHPPLFISYRSSSLFLSHFVFSLHLSTSSLQWYPFQHSFTPINYFQYHALQHYVTHTHNLTCPSYRNILNSRAILNIPDTPHLLHTSPTSQTITLHYTTQDQKTLSLTTPYHLYHQPSALHTTSSANYHTIIDTSTKECTAYVNSHSHTHTYKPTIS